MRGIFHANTMRSYGNKILTQLIVPNTVYHKKTEMENNLNKKSIFSNGLNADIPVAITPEHRYNEWYNR